MRTTRIVGFLLAVAGCGALVAACSSRPTVSSVNTPKAKPAVVANTATCKANKATATKITEVTCTLTTGYNTITLASLETTAHSYNSSVSATTPMVITAYGGDGAPSRSGGTISTSDQHGGSGGKAQTVTTEAAYKKDHGTATLLYYYIGEEGTVESHSGTGGAATIVSSANQKTMTACLEGYDSCSTSKANVVLLAGGGGGGGEGVSLGAAGGAGGTGGSAVATTNSSASGAGTAGVRGHYSTGGTGGGGGNAGAGGSGGSAGSGATPKNGTSGQAGVGGLGGPVHENKGPSSSPSWLTVGALSTVGSKGQGGEGEWEGTGSGYVGAGGGGGGGFGGGGGGGGGGNDWPGGGGGGGGSYAAEATTSAISPTITHTTNWAKTSQPASSSGAAADGAGIVAITFVLPS